MIVKPLPPIDPRDAQRTPTRDLAKDGWPLAALERMLADCEEQPQWRDRAAKAFAYVDNVDNEQMSPQQKFDAFRNGIEPRATNLIGRVVNGVLGQEAKSRRDPKLEADDDDFADVADVLNVKLKEAQRETLADMAISNAYKGQVVAGIGWVEVRRSADPFQYQYAVEDVPREQMWWDWRSRYFDLRNARWVCRAEWKDLDEVVASFPDKKDVLRNSVNAWATIFQDGPIDEEVRRVHELSDSTRFRQRTGEWRDGVRERIKLYHVQYRVPAMVAVMKAGHRTIVLDPENPIHVQAIQRKLAPIVRVPTMQIRNALYAGPYRLLDEPTTLKRFSYVPFFAFRREGDDTPYGLVEGMIAPQDDYNESSQRVRWMLKAQQLVMDSDALDETYNTVADITETMNRPDMVAVLNPNRTNRTQAALSFRNDLALQKELFERMQDSKMLIQDVPGVYSSQLGNAPQGVTSGIAINSLVEQGIVAMGELNDNYTHARRLVFENLVDLLVEDHAQADLQVRIGAGKARRVVVLNTVNPETREAMNVVKDAPVKLGLGEAPSSPAYQMQTAQMVGNMIQALAGTPHAAMLIPSWVESNSMFGPDRKQIADDMRRATGLPTAGDRQGAQQWQQQQQQMAAQQAEMAAQAAQAQVKKASAEADEANARVEKIGSETLKNLSDIATTTAANEDDLIEQALREAMGGGAPQQLQQPQQQPQPVAA